MNKCFFIIVCSLLVACSTDMDLDFSKSKLVVEGWIEDEGYPVVILTETFPISNEYQDLNSIKDYIVKWAKVTVSSETDTVILTGKYNNGYFPPYIYTTTNIKGESGKKYTLHVEYDEYCVIATTTIPNKPIVDTIIVEQCSDSDSLFLVKAVLTDNPNEANYYQVFSRVGAGWRQYFASFMGSFNDDVLQVNALVPIYQGRNLYTKNYIPYYKYNDTVSVKVSQIDSLSFQFWSEYMKTQVTSLNTFFSFTSNILSNIEGGVGYWCGYSSYFEYFIIDSTFIVGDKRR